MKWTKQLNIDIIHCYFNTILRIPNQPYRRDFHTRWTTLHPENPLTERRICDQQRVKAKKANTEENIRGAWITRLEIDQLGNDVSREIENERNPQQNELNNADVAIEGEHSNLPHNIIPPEENAIEQPNDINENELLKIKTLINAYAESIVTPFDKGFNLKKPGRKTIKKLEQSLEKVNDVIEAIPLLTEKIDGTSLNKLTCAAAITAIKTALVENECIIKKRNINRRKGDWTFNMNRRIKELRVDISKISQMNDPRPSPKMKRNANLMKTKYQIVDEQTRSTSLETLKQRLYALSNRLSRYQRRQK